MNVYEKFAAIREITKLEQEPNRHGSISYRKMIQTGALDFFDYLTGFLEVNVYPYYDGEKWYVRMWFATVDDGDFGGWSTDMPFEKAQKTAADIAKNVLEDMITLPTKDELNKLLRPYGMYVDYE